MTTPVTPEMILEERRHWTGLSHSLNVDGGGMLRTDCPCITCKNYFDPTGEEEAQKRNTLPPPPAAILGQQTGDKKSRKHAPSEAAIAAFDPYDYERLIEMGATDVKRIGDITNEKLAEVAAILQALIQQGKVYMMDKEDGSAWHASGVVGFKKGALLIFHES